MPARPDPTAPKRAARYEDRMRRRGLVKKHVWVPATKVPEFEAVVKKMRAQHDGAAAPDLKRIIARLRRHKPELRRAGIRHLALFGSVARGEATPESDIDIMVTFQPKAQIGLLEMSRLRRRLTELAKGPVDLALERYLKDTIRPQAMKDRVEVF